MALPRRITGPLGFIMLVGLAGCDTDASIQHTNEATTAQLNQIAANTSATAGRELDDNPVQNLTVATKPRKY